MNTRSPRSTHYDVAIVGARCSGASTAMLLARQGLRVLVIDRSREGNDTLSTHALMRGAVVQLAHWGLLNRVKAQGTPPIRTTTFYYDDEAIEVAIKPKGSVDALYAPRRTVLDPILVQAAREAGAEFHFSTSLLDLVRDQDHRVRGLVLRSAGNVSTISADLVIGADGVRSTAARLFSAEAYRQAQYATANIFGYWAGLDLEGYHWCYRPNVSAGAIATNGGLTCIFVSMPDGRYHQELAGNTSASYHKVLEEAAPQLSERVREGALVDGFRVFPGLRGYFRQSWGLGWALVGDAGYFRDPLTAHGITDALRESELLARAVMADSPTALAYYQAQRDELATGFFDLTERIASFDWTIQEVKELHLAISLEMKREVNYLQELHTEEYRKSA